MKFNRIAFAAVTALVCVGAAQAQDYRFGAQATVSRPFGDIGDRDALDGKIGFGLGGHMLIDLKDGHAIVPRLDYTMYKRSVDDGDIKWTTLNIGADYNYYLDGRVNEGFYLAAGLGFSRGKAEDGSRSESKNALAFGVGGGYMFNRNMGVELKYNHAKFSFMGDVTAPCLNASFVYRF